jgi:hypothetical protein
LAASSHDGGGERPEPPFRRADDAMTSPSADPPVIFLDFEASALGSRGYPIEVGWALVTPTGQVLVRAMLIRPDEAWADWDWSTESAAVHNIAREELMRNGIPVGTVAQVMNRDLAGQVVHSDHPRGDGFWLQVLFNAAGLAPTFRLKDIAPAFERVSDLAYERAVDHRDRARVGRLRLGHCPTGCGSAELASGHRHLVRGGANVPPTFCSQARLSSCLRRLEPHRIFPGGIRLRSIRRPGASITGTPSFAELGPGGLSLPVEEDGSARSSLQEIARRIGELNVVRLAAFRRCAERELTAEYEVFSQKAALLARDDLPSLLEMETTLSARTSPGSGWFSDIVYRVRSRDLSSLDKIRLRHSLVRYIVWKFNGVFKVIDLPDRLRRLIAASGGPREIVRHIEATSAAFLPAYIIVLCDTAFNLAACDELPSDPFTGEIRRGTMLIATTSALKMRADGSLVEGEVSDDLVAAIDIKSLTDAMPGVRALKMWMEMSGPIRARAELECCPNSGMLWLLPTLEDRRSTVALFPGHNLGSARGARTVSFLTRRVSNLAPWRKPFLALGGQSCRVP